jgi:hypothetical protein
MEHKLQNRLQNRQAEHELSARNSSENCGDASQPRKLPGASRCSIPALRGRKQGTGVPVPFKQQGRRSFGLPVLAALKSISRRHRLRTIQSSADSHRRTELKTEKTVVSRFSAGACLRAGGDGK